MTATYPRPLGMIKFLSWLIPITYLIHIAEEFWGGEGYPAYIYRLRGVHLSSTRFLVAQAIGFFLVTIGIVLSRRFTFPLMMLLILTATVLGNSLTHIYNAILTMSYNPGLISAAVIWVPMAIFVLLRFWKCMSATRYWIALALGILINVLIAVITMRGGRLA